MNAEAQGVSTPAPRSRTIFLIGPRGSGKTTVARHLAALLNRPWLDADEVLERRLGRSIREVFASEGELGFRNREEEVLKELAQRNGQIVATGGGVVLREANRALLRRGWVVWLSAHPDCLWARTQRDAGPGDRRPALTVLGGKDEVAAIVAAREPLYRACADLCLTTDKHAPEEIAAQVHAAWSALPS